MVGFLLQKEVGVLPQTQGAWIFLNIPIFNVTKLGKNVLGILVLVSSYSPTAIAVLFKC